MVLLSGGLDSAVLLAAEASEGPGVVPVYVRSGFAWEPAEAALVARLLEAPVFAQGIEPLETLTIDLNDVYPAGHWAVTGEAPAYDTPDEDVYLVGRNITLIAKTAVLCARRGVGRIALGPLTGNPFPDARPEFFTAMARAMSLGLDHPVAIAAPLAHLRKPEVIRMGLALGVPFADTLSCMSPVDVVHCGRCSKCRERREAWAAIGRPDPARYDTDAS